MSYKWLDVLYNIRIYNTRTETWSIGFNETVSIARYLWLNLWCKIYYCICWPLVSLRGKISIKNMSSPRYHCTSDTPKTVAIHNLRSVIFARLQHRIKIQARTAPSIYACSLFPAQVFDCHLHRSRSHLVMYTISSNRLSQSNLERPGNGTYI